MEDPSLLLLDRDGTINVKAPEGEYVRSPDELELLPGAADAVRRANDAGMTVAVVTNQRGVARGLMTEADVAAVNDRLQELLGRSGAHVDAWFVCPHAGGSCDCRKPQPGLLLAAMDRFGASPGRAVMIGDAESDVEAGRRAGVRTIRLTAPTTTVADQTQPDLHAAVSVLLSD